MRYTAYEYYVYSSKATNIMLFWPLLTLFNHYNFLELEKNMRPYAFTCDLIVRATTFSVEMFKDSG